MAEAINRPVSWADVKPHLRLDGDDQQAYVESLIDAAVGYAELAMGCSLLQRERTAVFYDGNVATLILPYGPLVSVTSVVDANGPITTYDVSRVGNSDRLVLRGNFATPVTVTYEAGEANAFAVPAEIRHAIRMHVATLYHNRESVSDKAKVSVPQTLEAFYRLRSRRAPVG